jgi:multimeric flavodoxin WrbA
MKTLILNGSPKKNGDTEALIRELAKHLDGEIKIISCYDDIKPCSDCRNCWSNAGCSIDDEMQEIYDYIENCDNFVIASPIWFSSLSGPVLNIASRMQTIYASNYFRKEPVSIKRKNGVIIIVGAEPGTEVIPTQNALTIMKFINVHRPSVEKIFSLNTNSVPAEKDAVALSKCYEVANWLNHLPENN